ncbi:hypothetical protein ACSBR2_016798 [Camellia fascicularis]
MRITKLILESVTLQTCSFHGLDQVQVQLKQALAGKKFLIVLDDVWNKKYSDWNVLKSPFVDGAQGSKVVVTTRNKDVARMMGAVELHDIEVLSDDDCWLLFAQHAFECRSIDANPNLVSIGKKIVEKCKGLPLAVMTLGGLLRCKERDEEWVHVLRSKIWDLPHEESDILPALRLCYHHLPLHLKQCFAYCSIIPNDYEFEEEELVLLWMAEGFIEQQREKQMEDVGGEYFRELLSRSFSNHQAPVKALNSSCMTSSMIWLKLEDKLKDQEQHINLKKARHSSYVQDHWQDADSLEEMSLGIGKLASLVTLSNFIVTKNNGFRIRELGNLIYLRGELSLSGLQNVVDPLDAREANLINKEGLKVLSMEWSVGSDESQDRRVETEMLNVLRPHKNLEELHIKCYLGTGFPTWIGDPLFSNMLCISLQNCKKCVSLPPLGQLPLLKDLCVEGMSALKHSAFIQSVQTRTPTALYVQSEKRQANESYEQKNRNNGESSIITARNDGGSCRGEV